MMNNLYHHFPQIGPPRQWPPPPPANFRPPLEAVSTERTVLHIEAAPVGINPQGRERTNWNTHIFACYQDFRSCVKTMICPCISVAENVEIITEGKTSDGEAMIILGATGLCGALWLYSCCIRTTIRRKFNIRGNFCTDCLAHFFCFPCAVCQEYRELDHQGFDPKLGWFENVERQKSAIAIYSITPPETETMVRV